MHKLSVKNASTEFILNIFIDHSINECLCFKMSAAYVFRNNSQCSLYVRLAHEVSEKQKEIKKKKERKNKIETT